MNATCSQTQSHYKPPVLDYKPTAVSRCRHAAQPPSVVVIAVQLSAGGRWERKAEGRGGVK